MKTNISLHFTPKLISLEQAKVLIEKALKLFPDQELTIHHCFLDRKFVESKGWDLSIVDYLESLEKEHSVHWWMAGKSISDIDTQRSEMLGHMKESNGKAIFLGPIMEGVEAEYNLVNQYDIENISFR